jgi:hypothetical protein
VNCEVEFREALTSMIPSLIKLVEDEEVGHMTVGLVCELANHGERQ